MILHFENGRRSLKHCIISILQSKKGISSIYIIYPYVYIFSSSCAHRSSFSLFFYFPVRPIFLVIQIRFIIVVLRGGTLFGVYIYIREQRKWKSVRQKKKKKFIASIKLFLRNDVEKRKSRY